MALHTMSQEDGVHLLREHSQQLTTRQRYLSTSCSWESRVSTIPHSQHSTGKRDRRAKLSPPCRRKTSSISSASITTADNVAALSVDTLFKGIKRIDRERERQESVALHTLFAGRRRRSCGADSSIFSASCTTADDVSALTVDTLFVGLKRIDRERQESMALHTLSQEDVIRHVTRTRQSSPRASPQLTSCQRCLSTPCSWGSSTSTERDRGALLSTPCRRKTSSISSVSFTTADDASALSVDTLFMGITRIDHSA